MAMGGYGEMIFMIVALLRVCCVLCASFLWISSSKLILLGTLMSRFQVEGLSNSFFSKRWWDVGRYRKTKVSIVPSLYQSIVLAQDLDDEYFDFKAVFDITQSELDNVNNYNGAFYLLFMGIPAPGYDVPKHSILQL